MSRQTDISDVIDGFDQLEARQTSTHCWTVTSYRNGSQTAHRVDLQERTCTCEDMQFNREGNECCDHILAANHYADRTLDVSEAIRLRLLDQTQRIEDLQQHLQQRVTTYGAQDEIEDTQTEPINADTDGSSSDVDPVPAFESWLESKDLPPDKFEYYVDSELGSLQIETDGYLSDGEFSRWVDAREEADLGYDPDTERNYLQADRFAEVLES